MLSEIAVEPFTLYIDCAGTLGAAQDPSIAKRPRHTRAHLWGRVWAVFDNLQARKTLAHATESDVTRGLTTQWERQGNDLADRYAKLGADLHELEQGHILEVQALASLAAQAARWAAEQYVAMARARLRRDS